jgi:hypothetical protein
MILAPNGRPARQQLSAQSLGSSGGYGWNNYFEAAKRSGYRTWFFFPSLDPSDQIIAWTREEIAKKLNWLYNNCPAAAAAIDGLAEEEADTGIWPSATTSNRYFNKAVTDAFDNDCQDPRFFDEAGEESFFTAQKAIRRNIYMLHDMFGQMLRPGEGDSIALPTMNFVPSWQVGNADRRDSARRSTRNNGSMAPVPTITAASSNSASSPARTARTSSTFPPATCSTSTTRSGKASAAA